MIIIDWKNMLRINIHQVLLFLIPIPLFIGLNLSIYNSLEQVASKVLPISFFIIFFYTIFNTKQKIKMSIIDYILIVIIIYSIIGFTYVTVINNNIFNINWLLLYFIPIIFGYIYGRILVNKFDLNNMLYVIILSTSIFSFIHILWSFFNYGVLYTFLNRGSNDIFGFFSIYQKLVSYPLFIGIVFFLLNFSKNVVKKTEKVILSIILLLELIIVGAREPLFIFVFMGFMYLSIYINIKLVLKVWLYIFAFISLLLLVNMLTDINVFNLNIFHKFYFMFTSTNADDFSGGRLHNILHFLDYIQTLNPLFGEGFTASVQRGSAHNQWLDLLTKGGFLFLIFIFIILVISIYLSFKLRKYNKNFILLGILLINLMFISFNINTPLRTPYTAILIWILIGYIIGTYIQYKNLNKKRKTINETTTTRP